MEYTSETKISDNLCQNVLRYTKYCGKIILSEKEKSK